MLQTSDVIVGSVENFYGHTKPHKEFWARKPRLAMKMSSANIFGKQDYFLISTHPPTSLRTFCSTHRVTMIQLLLHTMALENMLQT